MRSFNKKRYVLPQPPEFYWERKLKFLKIMFTELSWEGKTTVYLLVCESTANKKQWILIQSSLLWLLEWDEFVLSISFKGTIISSSNICQTLLSLLLLQLVENEIPTICLILFNVWISGNCVCSAICYRC